MRSTGAVVLMVAAAHGLVVLALVGGSVAQSPAASLDVPFVPTPIEVAETMLRMAKVTRGDTVYDLGSGDGRLVVMAAERYGARAVGIDIDPQRIAEARARARKAGVVDRTQFIQGDLFQADLAPATVLTLYLLPDVNRKLQPRILAQLRPGARVVSHNYDLGDWQPDAKQVVGDHLVYLWVVPARITGLWTWELALPGGVRRFTAEMDQTFQNVKGRVTAEGAEPASLTGRLDGQQISFTVVERPNPHPVTMRYQGQVVGAQATGTVTVSNGASSVQLPWRATATAGSPRP